MRVSMIALMACALMCVSTKVHAQEMPEPPKPQQEHQWLAQLAGDWKAVMEASMGPDAPPMKCEATQTAEMLGDRWLVATSQGEMAGQPMTSVLTIGYDPAKKKYVGSFIASCANEMWKYEGAVSDDGKKLVLETEGPNMMLPGKTSKYQETIELKDKDHYVFTSAMEGEDGKFVTFMTAKYERKK